MLPYATWYSKILQFLGMHQCCKPPELGVTLALLLRGAKYTVRPASLSR